MPSLPAFTERGEREKRDGEGEEEGGEGGEESTNDIVYEQLVLSTVIKLVGHLIHTPPSIDQPNPTQPNPKLDGTLCCCC